MSQFLRDEASSAWDRIHINSALIVLCFVAVLALDSQSAASYPSYFLALIMLLSVPRWADVMQTRLAWVIAVFLLYLGASTLWSSPTSGGELVSVAGRVLLVFLLVVALGEAQLRGRVQDWLGRGLALVGAGAVVASLVVFYGTNPADGRLNGLGQLDTHVVAALIFGVVLLFNLEMLWYERSPWWKLLALVVGVLCIWAVYLSDSRNAWMSVVLGVGAYVVAQLVADRQKFLASLVVLAVLLASALALVIADDAARAALLPRGQSFRPEIWQAALERITGLHWLFGLGIATPDALQSGGKLFQHPHNMYLAVVFQGGLIALALFIGLIVMVLRTLYLCYEVREAKLAFAVLAISLPSYLLDGHEIVDKIGETWFLFWLPVAIALGLRWSRPALEP